MINLRNALMTDDRRLPYDAEVEYLKSTGVQYIDTGVSPSDSTVWQMRCAPTAMYCLMGCMNAAARRFQITQIYGGNVARAYLGYGDSSQYPSYVQLGNISLNQFYDYEIDAAEGMVSMDGVSQPYPYDPAQLPTSLTLWLFGSNSDNESYKRCVSAKIANVKLIQNGVTVRDYISVRKGTVGALYDRRGVGGMNPDGSPRNDGMYFNRGEGDFEPGSDKN